jgi:hypothetical protein
MGCFLKLGLETNYNKDKRLLSYHVFVGFELLLELTGLILIPNLFRFALRILKKFFLQKQK